MVPRCALKVDLMKAYDSVRWDLLLAVLRVLGFPEGVVEWITECITSTQFSISINGELHSFFAGGRGLRRGDPLSHYLFVLAMEVFSGLMGLMVAEQDFKYHWRCEKEKITDLCFADDLMDCLNRFKALSGLIPNPDKSNLFASGISSYLKDQLLDIFGYKEGVLLVHYLGVPLISTNLRVLDCKVLVDRIITRAKSWTCRALLQLINCDQTMEDTLRAFLWKGCALSTDRTKVAWAKICMPKDEGGLGLRSMEIWNKSTFGPFVRIQPPLRGFHGHNATYLEAGAFGN
ncbi:uncharacterized protein LOC111408611 [Olea europaea var. sylvestris]|uniref:uncharacterized protein LOC111408611 n=1 Tax=Olea europaea var. sylvestris TaxID=158386 RepID=UPI000C1D5BB3|nr:uncharacterized protein LOC111408611 [Olea europaea var. sylvestris]